MMRRFVDLVPNTWLTASPGKTLAEHANPDANISMHRVRGPIGWKSAWERLECTELSGSLQRRCCFCSRAAAHMHATTRPDQCASSRSLRLVARPTRRCASSSMRSANAGGSRASSSTSPAQGARLPRVQQQQQPRTAQRSLWRSHRRSSRCPNCNRILPFNVSDFVPIGFVGEVPLTIAINRSLAVDSLPALIAASKQKSEGLDFAVPVRGGLTHLAVELLRARAETNFTNVYYPGSAQAMADVLSGRVPVIIDGLAGPIPKSQLQMLAITSPSRVSQYSFVPTVAETVPGFAATGWFALVAPPETPAAIVAELSADLESVLVDPQVKQKLNTLSVQTRRMTPAQLSAFIRSEQELWRPIIRRIGTQSR